ncbi:MAG: S-layer homology domain-containing protein, partial [Chloroflexi bacterium]|nr:S-layer homology domain-containing protein [Chloroflexota bacterium]
TASPTVTPTPGDTPTPTPTIPLTLTPTPTASPPPTATGAPSTYTWASSDPATTCETAIAYNYLDVVSGGTVVAASDDTPQQVNLPFTFTFYGLPYASLYVSPNGYLSFGQGYTNYDGFQIPNPASPNNTIYAFARDLQPDGGENGNVYYRQLDANRVGVEWRQAYVRGTGRTVFYTFQAILDRSDNSILLQYQNVLSDLSDYPAVGPALVGVENMAGSAAVVYNYLKVGNALAVKYTPAAAPTCHFYDAPTSYWAYTYIEALANSGITSGCTPTAYCPEDRVTRAQMAIFLLRGIHGAAYQPPAATGTMFTDVPAGYWAAAWIEQLAREGITAGCAPGAGDPRGLPYYCPEDPVTRAQMAIFLLRAEHGAAYAPPAASGVLFTDVPVNYWAAAWIEQLANEGITSGCAPGAGDPPGLHYNCPEDSVTRAQKAVFLVRTFDLPLP